MISTHTSLAGRDDWKFWGLRKDWISTHTSLAGRDFWLFVMIVLWIRFLLTRPSRDVTFFDHKSIQNRVISTHTSLAGRDYLLQLWKVNRFHFYSHVPRGT